MKEQKINFGIAIAEASRILSTNEKKEVLVRIVMRHPDSTDMPTYQIFKGIGKITKNGLLHYVIREHNGSYLDLSKWADIIESIEVSTINYKNFTDKLEKPKYKPHDEYEKYKKQMWRNACWDNAERILLDDFYIA